MQKLRILTWHVHGSYLYYLSQVRHDFFIPYDAERTEGYLGRTKSYDWPANLHEVPLERLRELKLDCVLYQHRKQFLHDRWELLTAEQRKLPALYLEHDPPQEHPTNTKHWVDDPEVLVVHVTAFNRMMWDNGRSPTTVIPHGVIIPETTSYTGELARGIVVVNNIARRGRRLGFDIYREAREQVPLDLFGMGWEAAGGRGELKFEELFEQLPRYRFFFNPIRYTSLGLAVCEAMTAGVPILGMATTEMVRAVQNGINGFVETDLNKLLEHMRRLLSDRTEAQCLSDGARRIAREHFNIERFIRDWDETLHFVTGTAAARGVRQTSGSVATELL